MQTIHILVINYCHTLIAINPFQASTWQHLVNLFQLLYVLERTQTTGLSKKVM